jgi:hypothetical protein
MPKYQVETETETQFLLSTFTLVFKGIWLTTDPQLREDIQAIKSTWDQPHRVVVGVLGRRWFIRLAVRDGSPVE